MNTDRVVYIYCHVNPHSHEIRYVGYTVHTPEERLRGHYDTIARKDRAGEKHTFHHRWLKKLRISPLVEVLEVTTESHADSREIWWIDYLRSLGCDLTNETLGGKGTLGWIQSQETRDRRSVSLRKAWKDHPEHLIVGAQKSAITRTGQKRSNEARAKMSAAKRGKPWSQAQRSAAEELKNDAGRNEARLEKLRVAGALSGKKYSDKLKNDAEFAAHVSKSSKYKMHIRWHVNAGKSPKKPCEWCSRESTNLQEIV